MGIKNNGEFGGHEFKKSLGQNFIKDKNLLVAIANDANITADDFVVEVGAGAGTLTKVLCDNAKFVLSYEIDTSLKTILSELEGENKNLKIEYADALKTSNEEILQTLESCANEKINNYKLVANIPYYITTPLIFKFLKDEKVSSLTVMVQKEVAQRIASSETSGDYGAISVIVHYLADVEIKRIVNKQMFYPVPKVDSAILQLTKKDGINLKEYEMLEKVVKSAFSNRRKVMVSNLSKDFHISKETLVGVLTELHLNPLARAENLSVNDFIELTNKIIKLV